MLLLQGKWTEGCLLAASTVATAPVMDEADVQAAKQKRGLCCKNNRSELPRLPPRTCKREAFFVSW